MAEALAEGQRLAGRFRLVRPLGRGGMGEVWLAEDEQLTDRVALKILAPSLASRPDLIELLRAECRQARALVHPNIVRVFDFHSADDSCFISMQFIDGPTLAALRGVRYPAIIPAALQVCDALEYAHREKIIHRDIKPTNVLLDERGVAHLADFGIAGALAVQSSRRSAGGSLPSMSPQQLSGKPAAIADDVYGFGAMLYELLSGTALFSPDVTPQSIREVVPEPLSVDGTGAKLPDRLIRLVAATLDKSPERRPAGMGAVRAVLEEIKADTALHGTAENAGRIRPLARRAPSGSEPQPDGAVRDSTRTEKGRGGWPPGVVIGGLGILMAIAGAVVFLLPDMVADRPPPVRAQPAPSQPSAVAARPGADARRGRADEVLADLLPLEDRLRAAGIEQWGGEAWAEARRATSAGDDAYLNRDYDLAQDHYREALRLMKSLEPRGPEVLAKALADGAAALEAGDRASALQNFELALAVDKNNADAQAGLDRALNLDRVLEAVGRAERLENDGELGEARNAYADALEIDADWTPARQGLDRVSGILAAQRYETSMAAGYAALDARDFAAARRAFQAALAARANDADARAALAQLGSDEKLQRIIAIQNEARQFAAREKWPEAIERYEAAVALDSSVSSSAAGLANARARQDLHQRMISAIGRADELNDERKWQVANRALSEARQIEAPGPVISEQIETLSRLLAIAAEPVPVRFRSDNQTEVTIYKVGQLGTFTERTMQLRPGRYVAVGSRDGYRDVRKNFIVDAGGNSEPVELRCEEPI